MATFDPTFLSPFDAIDVYGHESDLPIAGVHTIFAVRTQLPAGDYTLMTRDGATATVTVFDHDLVAA